MTQSLQRFPISLAYSLEYMPPPANPLVSMRCTGLVVNTLDFGSEGQWFEPGTAIYKHHYEGYGFQAV